MSGILGLLGNAAFGGILGNAFSAFNKWQDNKLTLQMRKADQEHETKLQELEMQSLQMQLESQEAIATVGANAEVAKADYSALEASLEADKATYSTTKGRSEHSGWMVFVDFVRGMVRPTLTTILTCYCIVLSIYIVKEFGTDISNEQMGAILMLMTDATVFNASTALGWWFGSKGKSVNYIQKVN